jgi:hypothetical protein
MSDSRKSVMSRTGTLLACAGIVGVCFLATRLANLDKGFSIKVGTDGTAQIDVRADDSFADVLDKALKQTPDEVDAILVGKQYYKITDKKIVSALASTKNAEIANGLRKMLWNLDWPFDVPGTLRGADKRMTDALDDLDNELQDPQAKEANELLATLWNLMIDQQSIFKQRSFKATVEVTGRAPTGNGKTKFVYACPGSSLTGGRVIQIYTSGYSMLTEVKQDPSIFDCGGSALTVRQMLAGGNARLGLSKTAFNELVQHGSTTEDAEAKSQALFVVYPRDLVGAFNK